MMSTEPRCRIGAAILSVLVAWMVLPGEAGAWGWAAHRIITKEAAGRMPGEVASFFSTASAGLSELSLEPDRVLKRTDPAEGPRHYINLDSLDDPPFDRIPAQKSKAEDRFGAGALKKSGTLPWRVLKTYRDLRKSMKKGDREKILRDAGYLAHYVGDLFQPLHLVTNHDGQKTCNLGIHGAFESEMIERRETEYAGSVARGEAAVVRLGKPAREVFRWMKESWSHAEKILAADSEAIKALKSKRTDYYDSMDRMAGPIAESQMSKAANALGSLWYTAWLEAGRPDLP